MHNKTVNIGGEYQCIIVGHNSPVRVDMRKGHEAIYLLSFFMFVFRVDNIYLSLNYGGSQVLLLLVFQLILIVRWSTQYIINGCSRF